MNTKLRPLAWAAYSVAFILIVVPLTEVLLGIWPLRIGQVNWRFGAAGLVSQSVITPLLGMLLAVTTAALVEHRVTARVLAGFALLGGVLGALALAMFSLDALEARSAVRTESLQAFDKAAVVAAVKFVLGSISAVLLGVGGWKASRRHGGEAAARERKSASDDSPVLVGARES